MREISLDTETTGLNPKSGHRIVEIGCVEMINHIATDQYFHVYINPERDMPEEAFKVHGLSEEFLSSKPKFKEVAQGFLDFIGDSPLVIHNAAFDMGFLNWELENLGKPALDMSHPSIPYKLHVKNSLALKRTWMRCAAALASTTLRANCTAPCWMLSCWLMCIWN